MSPGAYVAVTGFSLIAVCYGFARFAFGLFLPQIDAELSLSSTVSGFISGGSFLGYCFAILLAAHLTERIGARMVAIWAAVIAAIGMLGIAWSPSAPWLAASVLLAGSSTGLASPPMAVAVATLVPLKRQDATNTFINAGTSAGVVLSGPVALMMVSQWRWAFALFAVSAFAMAVFAAFTLPRATVQQARSGGRLPTLNGALKRLIVAAFLMGAASTAVWSFGGQLATLHLDWRTADISLLWVVIGAAGIAGAAAGALTGRFGISRVHWVTLATLAAGILMVGLDRTTAALALSGGSLFGAAYIMLTGIYLVWGISALPDRPATGLMIGFLAIAAGQTAGAPVFGYLASRLTTNASVITYASLALAAGLASTGCVSPIQHRSVGR